VAEIRGHRFDVASSDLDRHLQLADLNEGGVIEAAGSRPPLRRSRACQCGQLLNQDARLSRAQRARVSQRRVERKLIAPRIAQHVFGPAQRGRAHRLVAVVAQHDGRPVRRLAQGWLAVRQLAIQLLEDPVLVVVSVARHLDEFIHHALAETVSRKADALGPSSAVPGRRA